MEQGGSRGKGRWGEIKKESGGPTHKLQTQKASSPGNVCFEEVLHAASE